MAFFDFKFWDTIKHSFSFLFPVFQQIPMFLNELATLTPPMRVVNLVKTRLISFEIFVPPFSLAFKTVFPSFYEDAIWLVNLKPVSRRSKYVFRGHDRAPIVVLTTKVHVSKLSHDFYFLLPRLSTKLVWFLDLGSSKMKRNGRKLHFLVFFGCFFNFPRPERVYMIFPAPSRPSGRSSRIVTTGIGGGQQTKC
eukprot:sb/3470975/